MKLKLFVKDKNGAVLSESTGQEQISLVHKEEYQEGDAIMFECERAGFYEVQFEDTMPVTIVYVDKHAEFTIPFGTMPRVCYSPRAFSGPMHLITAREANPDFVSARRNLALNPYDQSGSTSMYPRAAANVVTRGEALFAARNAIDGIFTNTDHSFYPYQSWGINRDPNAQLKVEFGIPVNLDTVRLTLRADFPHDSHWTHASLEFSDGSVEHVALSKSPHPQSFPVDKKNITWVMLKDMKKADDDSPFPALRQMEAWGKIS